jgi:hypothetical protein
MRAYLAVAEEELGRAEAMRFELRTIPPAVRVTPAPNADRRKLRRDNEFDVIDTPLRYDKV